MKQFFSSTAIFIILFLFAPYNISQASGLVPCGVGEGQMCNACHAVSLVNTLINYLISLFGVIAVIILIIVGFRLVTSGGNTEAWSSAKSAFTNLIIGFILVLASWLIVDTIMKGLTGRGLDAMTSIQCVGVDNSSASITNPAQQNSSNASGVTLSSTYTAAEEAREEEIRNTLVSYGYTINKSSCRGKRYQEVVGGCTSVDNLQPETLSALDRFSRNCTRCSPVITGGSEAGHQTHDGGKKVDLRFSPNVDSYIRSGGDRENGLRCVAESDHWHCSAD